MTSAFNRAMISSSVTILQQPKLLIKFVSLLRKDQQKIAKCCRLHFCTGVPEVECNISDMQLQIGLLVLSRLGWIIKRAIFFKIPLQHPIASMQILRKAHHLK